MSSNTTTDDKTAEVSETPTDKKLSPEPAEELSESGNSDEADQDDSDTEAEADEDQNPNAEAAKWRHRFREEKAGHQATQAQLTAVAGRVEALQRQQIESLIATANVKPAALWATTELAALVTEDGIVDTDAVAAAIETSRQTLGITPISKGVHVPGVGSKPDSTPEVDGWLEAFKPKRK